MDINTIYIVSAGRPHCRTAALLERIEYKGDWYICVSREDDKIDEYKERWGSRVITYSYAEQMADTDMLDPFNDPIGGAAPARNGVAAIARSMGNARYWMLDDDITAFTLPKKNGKSRRTVTDGEELEHVMLMVAEWAHKCGIGCVGGACDMQPFPPEKNDVNWYVRQMYNIPVDSRKFRSRMEEDLCYACDSYRTGENLCIALKLLGFRMKGVCDEDGGCTTIYEKNGSIRRAAYNILVNPLSEVKRDRFEYSGFPKWRMLVPKLIDGSYRKA